MTCVGIPSHPARSLRFANRGDDEIRQRVLSQLVLDGPRRGEVQPEHVPEDHRTQPQLRRDHLTHQQRQHRHQIVRLDRVFLPKHVGLVAPRVFNQFAQAKARAAGLWNLGLPELGSDEPGTRLSNLEYAPLAEIMGRLFWASEAFNCQAPDVPNMIALQNCANPEQKQRWLRPLLSAETRSAFGMTEPDVASSDATNIATRMVRDGDD